MYLSNNPHGKVAQSGERPPTSGPQKNNYVLCLAGEEPASLNLYDYDLSRHKEVNLDYYIETFKRLERKLGRSGLTFYILWDSPRFSELPSYGPDVVALLLLDEICRLPPYYGRVGLVMRPYGRRPTLARPIAPDYFTILNLVKFARNIALWLPTWLRYQRNRMVPRTRGGHRRQAVEVIPLGYANQAALPLKPFDKREYFFSFAGSVIMNKDESALRKLMRSPKEVGRARMLEAARRFAERHPDVPTNIRILESFADSITSDPVQYASLINDTKICLVPRGSTIETYRFFEAIRYGSVVICERLPDHSFYRNSPAIQLDRWSDLESVLEQLRRNPSRLLELHHQSLDWWRTHCSEEALAERLAHVLSRD